MRIVKRRSRVLQCCVARWPVAFHIPHQKATVPPMRAWRVVEFRGDRPHPRSARGAEIVRGWCGNGAANGAVDGAGTVRRMVREWCGNGAGMVRWVVRWVVRNPSGPSRNPCGTPSGTPERPEHHEAFFSSFSQPAAKEKIYNSTSRSRSVPPQFRHRRAQGKARARSATPQSTVRLFEQQTADSKQQTADGRADSSSDARSPFWIFATHTNQSES